MLVYAQLLSTGKLLGFTARGYALAPHTSSHCVTAADSRTALLKPASPADIGRQKQQASATTVASAKMQSQQLALPDQGIDVDGSILEGGGQILRIAAALSAITGTPIRVRNIRAKREKPGLRAQHLAGLQLVAQVCSGHLQGGSIGSTTITLVPGAIQVGEFTADTRTAGSCCLLAQAAMPPLLFAGCSGAAPEGRSLLRLLGGTDADMAPPVGYLQQVLLPTLQRWGIHVNAQLDCRGFFPKGGGSVTLAVAPISQASQLQPIRMAERGKLEAISIHAFSAGSLNQSIAERLATGAEHTLRQGLAEEVPITKETSHYTQKTVPAACGNGAGILITARASSGCILGAASPGQRGVPSEEISTRVATELLKDIARDGCCDRWLEDQLIIFMALARDNEDSVITCGEPTLHTRTAMVVAEQLTNAKFSVEQPSADKQYYTIRCRGAGINARQQS